MPTELPDPLAADHARNCEICGASPVVAVTGLCGPCSFGGEAQAAAVWRPDPPTAAEQQPPPPAMPLDEALIRLGTELPEEAFASVHRSDVALANRDVAEDLRQGTPARVHTEWSVLVTAPGFSHSFAGDALRPVVEQAIREYFAARDEREAEEWSKTAIPDTPPRLAAPTTAEEQRTRREKDVG